jgi:hypothetical protein
MTLANLMVGLVTVVLVVSILSIIKKRHFTKSSKPSNTPSVPRVAGPAVETAPWIDTRGSETVDNRGDGAINPPVM